MLVIPAIEIKDCRCVRTVATEALSGEQVYSDNPAEMAMLWRKENAKTIHVTDYDGLYAGHMDNMEAIASVAARVEIPVQLVARFESTDECRQWLGSGIYRLVIHDLIQRDPEGVRALVSEFGPSRICAGAITQQGRIATTWREVESVDAVDFARAARELGMNRLFFSDRDHEGELRGPNTKELRRIATGASLHITAAGGVASVEHLWLLQEMEPLGIDSVVIGRAFYENRFPCQQLWRDIELERIARGHADEVSTALIRGTRQSPPPTP
jgi:phosphoribosylformimino-5-aminoimidazole carboxamide ribotide isomerase